MQEVFTPTWSNSLIDLVTFGIVPSSPSTLPPTPLSRKVQHRILPTSFLGRALLHDPKSFTFDYLDEKLIDTGLTKFLGLCPSALSRYLEFVSISSAPFTTKRSSSMRARDQ